MSTIASTERLDSRQITGPGLSFGRLLKVELRKQVDTRGGRGLLIAIAIITFLALAGVMWFTRKEGAPFSAFIAATASPQGMLIPVLGIMTACSEWSQRTALITFTQEPRRARVILAKTLAAMIWATGFLLLAYGLAAVMHAITQSIAGVPMDFDYGWKDLLQGWMGQMVGVLQGVAFGLLLLITPLAIAAYFVLPTVVTGVFFGFSSLRKYSGYLSTLAPPIVEGPSVGMEPVTNAWPKFITSVMVWVVIPYVAGFIRVMKREVK